MTVKKIVKTTSNCYYFDYLSVQGMSPKLFGDPWRCCHPKTYDKLISGIHAAFVDGFTNWCPLEVYIERE